MKLATYRDGSRDGQLVVVSRDLARAHFATGIAGRMQQLLDDWNFISPQLQDLYDTLNRGQARHAFDFNPALCRPPLPRAFQWLWADRDGALHQGSGDALHGAQEELALASEAWGIGAEAGLAVITGDIAAGSAPEQALEGVRLLALAAAWRLHALDNAVQSRPAAVLGPVAVTPDELGDAWEAGRLGLPLLAQWNGRPLPVATAADFGLLLAQAARTRPLHAGSVAGACTAAFGAADTGFIRNGDLLQLELRGRDGDAPLGRIEQRAVIGGA